MSEIQELIALAPMIKNSSLIPSHLRNERELVASMLLAKELGLNIVSGLQNISVIQGKPTLNSHVLWALVMKQSDLENVKVDTSDNACTVTIKRKIGEFKSTFTLEDAKKAGLLKSGSWEKYPRQMLEARAKSTCARLAYPEAIMGLYSKEEMEDVAIQESREVQVQISPANELEQKKELYIKKVDIYMQDKVLTADEGLDAVRLFKECETLECLQAKGKDLAEYIQAKKQAEIDKEASEVFDNALNLQIKKQADLNYYDQED